MLGWVWSVTRGQCLVAFLVAAALAVSYEDLVAITDPRGKTSIKTPEVPVTVSPGGSVLQGQLDLAGLPASGRLEFYNRMLPPLPFAVAQGSERPGQLVHPDSIQPGPWDPALFRDRGAQVRSRMSYAGSNQPVPLGRRVQLRGLSSICSWSTTKLTG